MPFKTSPFVYSTTKKAQTRGTKVNWVFFGTHKAVAKATA
jgi:hypothetical protein